ncbi:glycerophosphodiester phosphodiesterase family protein [Microbacterium sp. SORGH_AS_0888]|uniref:glycerophosphodiester phosphodiesterase family protein n=1 Tax=Microbacterium sp. SORGH_AS_0888 TaxID=3041791 RepID=UPI002785E88A|nr:glycerophosphodiester phosphodiesterase family protein [Microbacterium sp. SORGH_AS_0888]MDQ1128471.1 glycerophosphoryl diester phosphodiesterase [Microbacterium sp. SORGH_AS_0888]
MAHPYLERTPRPRVLAHRGLVGASERESGVVENSFAALAAAHAAGVHYIESDCHLTRDGVVVLFHDEDLRRVTGDPRRLRDVDLRELERIMSGRGGLVTLAQALEAFPETRFNVDVKAADAALPAGRLVAPVAERVLLTSFSDARRRAALAAAAVGRPEMRPATSAGSRTIVRLLAAVAVGSAAAVRRALRGVDAVQVPERQGAVRILTPRFVRLVHAADVEVHVWTVNDPDDMRRLVDAGVDGIVTDRADLALDVLGAAG